MFCFRGRPNLQPKIKQGYFMQKRTTTHDPNVEQLKERVERLEAQMRDIALLKVAQHDSGRYLDLQNACDMLGVSRSTFYLEMQAGRIPYTMVGRQRKFLEKDLKEYLTRNYVPAKKSIL